MTRSRMAVWVILSATAAGCAKHAANVCGHPAEAIGPAAWVPNATLAAQPNPIIGTANSGNAIPGALVPHGVVRLSPDTNQPSGSVVAYDYGDDQIQGFSHTHLEGAGGGGYGYSQILVMPTRGAIATTESGYESAFDHSTEVAQPGYYAVRLETPGVLAELTATQWCGVHRYTFDGNGAGNVLIDVAHTRGGFAGGQVEVVGSQEIRGTGHYVIDPEISFALESTQSSNVHGSTGARLVAFDARFSRPFDSFGTWEGSTVTAGSRAAQTGPIGAYATFNSAGSAPIELQVCLSSISPDQAAQNLESEVSGSNFDQVRTEATAAWDQMLNRVEVQGGTAAQQQIFYTALYRSFMQPADATEGCQFWSGESGSGAAQKADGWDYYTDDWCLWDTYRTVHPLQNLLEPDRASDIVRSIVNGYQQGGWMNKCTWDATGYSRFMTAIPYAPIIADAYVKGFRNYDTATAFQGLMKMATTDDEPLPDSSGLGGYLDDGTPPLYTQLGYVPHEFDADQSASMTLEYAFEDWSLSAMADAMGDSTDRDRLRAMANSYRNVFNPAEGFMQGRHQDGTWVTPFDPTAGTDFTEATSWIYTWLVPHDEAGLINLLGGASAFGAKLDAFFDGGHDDPSNEPSFETPYLYNYAGAPAKTQQRVSNWLAQEYSDDPGGLPGNDDSGAMSAWYVWSALGLYPITPGDDTLLIGSPVFSQATIRLDPNYFGGKTFVIQAFGVGPESPYIQSATLNGAPLNQPWIRFGDVIKGGVLSLQMGPNPSTWGSDPRNVPPSMSTSP